jgi:hypothetical protein
LVRVHSYISRYFIICSCDISGNSASAGSLSVCPQIGLSGEPGHSQASKLRTGLAALFSIAHRTQIFAQHISKLLINFCEVSHLLFKLEVSKICQQNTSNIHIVFHGIVSRCYVFHFAVLSYLFFILCSFIYLSVYCDLCISRFIALSYLLFILLC